MNNKANLIILMVGMFIFMPTFCFSKEKSDSSILEKMWSYKRNYTHQNIGNTTNTYMRYTLNTERRNFTMFLIPSLYAFAKDDRQYISEIYGKMEIESLHKFNIRPQIISSNIPHDRQVSDAFINFSTPNIYDMTLYDDMILSPFYRSNRFYYRYKIENEDANIVHVNFRPKLKNTQLVKGYALVNRNTGRIVYTTFDGEYDMLKFHIDVVLGSENTSSILPQRCTSDLKFNFMGNKVTSHFLATYDNPTTLPDTLNEVHNREKMDSLRTFQLNDLEKEIYRKYDEQKAREHAEWLKEKEKEKEDSLHPKKRSLGDFLWDIGDKLVTSSHADALGAKFTLSPILNPQYISYSPSRGLSYKIQLGARYNWNKKRYLTIRTQIGYNFKIKQFFHYTPIRMTYNPKRNGYAELVFANGNRISNSSIIQTIKNMNPDVEFKENPNVEFKDIENLGLNYFTDNYIKAYNNVAAFDWLEIKTGIVFHIRRPDNKEALRRFKQPTSFRSFAPSLTLHVSPWNHGPYLTMNYERSIKGILGSNSEYERYEFDVSHKFKLNRLRLVNLKGGFGFYTNNETTYFLDYANFHEENLPGGWEDEWTGYFQLLNSDWYNMSKYYLRLNTSYESPLLVFSFLPFVGKYIEHETIYLSLLSIQHTRPYAEIGYGITTRFISIGAFASMLGKKFEKFGVKFTIELFRNW